MPVPRVQVLGFPAGNGILEPSLSRQRLRKANSKRLQGAADEVFVYTTKTDFDGEEEADSDAPSEESWLDPHFSPALFFMLKSSHETRDTSDVVSLTGYSSGRSSFDAGHDSSFVSCLDPCPCWTAASSGRGRSSAPSGCGDYDRAQQVSAAAALAGYGLARQELQPQQTTSRLGSSCNVWLKESPRGAAGGAVKHCRAERSPQHANAAGLPPPGPSAAARARAHAKWSNQHSASGRAAAGGPPASVGDVTVRAGLVVKATQEGAGGNTAAAAVAAGDAGGNWDKLQHAFEQSWFGLHS